MKSNAEEFASFTRVVLIGLNYHHSEEFDTLNSPIKDVDQLYTSLTSPDGCSVPQENVIRIVNEEATKTNILSTIKNISKKLSNEHNLLLYFAGHATGDENDFYLAVADTTLSDLTTSALKGEILGELLSSIKTRGILIVLDCCEGAGFAEKAPNVFRELNHSEFRILLSASRAEEPSWELPDVGGTIFSKHLIDAISGHEIETSTPGLIYFSELLRNVQDKVSEDLDSLYPNQPKQEPVFVGVFVKDPLLFVHKRLTLQQIALKTTRYSKQYVRQVIRKSLVALGVLLFFVTGTVYTILSKQEFAVSEQNRITIYKGYPGISLFSFPKKLWSFSLEPQYAKDGSPLRASAPLVSKLGEPILPILMDNLKPEYQALVLQWQGMDSLAREKVIRIITDENIIIDERVGPMIIFSGLAIERDTTLLLDIMKSTTIDDIKANTLRRLTRLAPWSAINLIMDETKFNTRNNHAIILQYLPQEPQSDYQAYFEYLLKSEVSYTSHPSLIPEVLEAAMRTDQRLSVQSLLKALQETGYSKDIEDITSYVWLNSISGFDKAVFEYLKEILKVEDLFEDVRAFDLQDILHFYELSVNQNCKTEFSTLLDPRFEFFYSQIVKTLLTLCPENRVEVAGWFNQLSQDYKKDLIREATYELVSNKVLPMDSLMEYYDRWIDKNDHYEIGPFLDELKKLNYIQFTSHAKELLTSNESEIKKSAIEFLDHIKDSTELNAELFLDNQIEVQLVAYQYQFKRKPEEAISHLLNRMEDIYLEEYLAELIFDFNLEVDNYPVLFQQLEGSPIEKKNAATIITLKGKNDEVLNLLTHYDPEIREVATDYLPANLNFGEILDDLAREVEYPDFNYSVLKHQKEFQQRIIEMSEEISPEYTSWYIDIVFRTQNLENGMRLWAKSLGSTSESYGTGMVGSGHVRVSK